MQKPNTATASGAGMIQFMVQFGFYFIFILLIIFFALQSDQFLTLTNLSNILQQSAALGIATVGMVFVLLIAGIDISVGSTMYLSAIVAAIYLSNGGNLYVGILIAIVCGALVGTLNGFIIARYRIVAFITTLATLGIAKGLGLLFSKSELILIGETSQIISGTTIFGINNNIVIFVVILVIGNYVLRYTPFGKQLFAIGNDKHAAEKIGINVNRKIFIAYVICGTLAGFAGIISAGQVSAVTGNFANANELIIISAAVIGGTSLFGGKGNVLPGVLFGIITITTIVNGLTMMNASPYAYEIVNGLIIFIAVMVDSFKHKGDIH